MVASNYTLASEKVTYYYTDQQGTPLVSVDATSGLATNLDYKPYGSQALGIARDGPGFTSHVFDVDVNLIYMQARYYDPEVGRFLSSDPGSRDTGNIFDQNNYLYGRGNPIRYLDPDGKRYAEAWAAQGAVIGGGTVAVASVGVDAVSGGLNLAATPIEISGGVIAGTYIGYKVGALVDSISGTSSQKSESNAPPAAAPTDGNTNPYNGPVDSPVVVVDKNGNAIPVDTGHSVQSSPNGDYQQVRDSSNKPTGDRLDRGGHKGQKDPAAQQPHAHRPNVTTDDGNPHLPINQ
jgi:RHS repeat-associated protein